VLPVVSGGCTVQGMAKKQSKGGGRHRNPMIGFRPPQDVAEVLAALAAAEDRNLAQMTLVLVKEALRARGRLSAPAPHPPPDTPTS
jgi:hypothetical protein